MNNFTDPIKRKTDMDTKIIVIATPVTSYKLYSLERCLDRNFEIKAPEGYKTIIYLNINEKASTIGDMASVVEPYKWVFNKYLGRSNFHVDTWIYVSTWKKNRQKNQDQTFRTQPVITARNMAREFALRCGAEAILYVDSDEIAPINSLVELWKENKLLISGAVPGRGCHSHVHYFGPAGKLRRIRPNLLCNTWAACGFCLIKRLLFLQFAWRWGARRDTMDVGSAEPMMGTDTQLAGFEPWYIRTDVVAEHLDDPAEPLTPDQIAGGQRTK